MKRIGSIAAEAVIAAVLASVTAAFGGDVTSDDLTVHGKLEVETLTGSAPTNGLILYYSCTTSNSSYVLDESGNNRTGTVYGAVWQDTGISGGTYDYDGVDDYIQASAPYSLSVASVSMWLKVHDLPASLRYAAISYTYSGQGSGSHDKDMWVTTSGTFQFYIWNGSGKVATSDTVLTTNQWYHVTGVTDGSTVKIYVNGVLEDSQAAGYSWGSGTKFVLSFKKYAVHEYYDGQIDEVRVYNRALSSNEVYDLYIYNCGRPPSASRFNDGIEYSKALGDIPCGAFTNSP